MSVSWNPDRELGCRNSKDNTRHPACDQRRGIVAVGGCLRDTRANPQGRVWFVAVLSDSEMSSEDQQVTHFPDDVAHVLGSRASIFGLFCATEQDI